MKTDAVNDRCARCSQGEDDLLLDAEAAAKALMRDAAETVALRARVKELEEALRDLIAVCDLALIPVEAEDTVSSPCLCEACRQRMVASAARARRALHRPTPRQERP